LDDTLDQNYTAKSKLMVDTCVADQLGKAYVFVSANVDHFLVRNDPAVEATILKVLAT
jgi:hypothetical protein